MAPTPATARMTPSAGRLTTSLRDIGYDFPAAVADLVDNSVTARATRIDVTITFDGTASRVAIADNGTGMSENALVESLRFGSRRRYSTKDLGRYGLGLKTASLSQCRCLTVVTSKSPERRRPAARQLSLDVILDYDDWLILDPGRTSAVDWAHGVLGDAAGTVVVWEQLDRVLPENRPGGGWARRRLASLTSKTAEHLSMVFHRFLERNSDQGVGPLEITVNGTRLEPWNPFAPTEAATNRLGRQTFEVVVGEVAGKVVLDRYVLPPKESFSSPSEFERLSGPLKWNRQQGLYVYRAERLVQWGGWGGIRGIDEHTKLARAALHFDTDLDEAFNINVAKMRVSLPASVRQMLEQPLHEVCLEANAAYRSVGRRPGTDKLRPTDDRVSVDHLQVGQALRSAAFQAGEYRALKTIAASLREHDADLARLLGL